MRNSLTLLSCAALSFAAACSGADGGLFGGRGNGGGDGDGTGALGGGDGDGVFDNGGSGAIGGSGAVGGTGAMAGTGGEEDGCSSVEESTPTARNAVDIIWVIDNSGSMGDEIAAVQTNINAFADQISMAGVDHHVIVLTATDVAAGTALGGDAAHYLHRPVSIGSNDLLDWLLLDYPNYKPFLRPGAPTHFIAVTDDESFMAAADFQAQMGANLPQGFMFHSIASEDAGGGAACAGACGIPFACGAFRPGLQYYALSDATGGEKISICTADWSQVFGPLQNAVIDSLPLPCEYPIPAPPSGESLDPDLVNIEYTGADGVPQTFPRADAEGQCGDLTAWYYDDALDPNTIHLCPSSCSAVEGGGSIKIVFGCATVPVQ